ncbi:MAG: hypothetical protein U5J62_10375 [Desulfurivibrio sp.]|nr:hypothetical protein [Desulfurivibrio sp.]
MALKARRLPVTQPGSKGEAIDLDNWRQPPATADAGQGEAAPVVVESLVRQRQAVDEVQAVVARVGEGGPGEKPTPAAAGEETPPRYQSETPALDRQQDPTLALLLFIDRARLAPDMPSPLAGVARQLSGWSREWQQDEAAPPARQLARQQQELYRQWLESRDAGCPGRGPRSGAFSPGRCPMWSGRVCAGPCATCRPPV